LLHGGFTCTPLLPELFPAPVVVIQTALSVLLPALFGALVLLACALRRLRRALLRARLAEVLARVGAATKLFGSALLAHETTR
jgi:predicted membrane protein